MEIIVDLMDIISSYRDGLKSKLNADLNQMEIFTRTDDGVETPVTVTEKRFIRFS